MSRREGGWILVDCHQCNRCGHLDTTRDGIEAHLAMHERVEVLVDAVLEEAGAYRIDRAILTVALSRALDREVGK